MLAALGVVIPELLDRFGDVQFSEPVWWRVGYAKLQVGLTYFTKSIRVHLNLFNWQASSSIVKTFHKIRISWFMSLKMCDGPNVGLILMQDHCHGSLQNVDFWVACFRVTHLTILVFQAYTLLELKEFL